MNGQNLARVLPVVAVGNPVERLESLFDNHYARLYRLARRLTSSADDALDLVQETFLKAAKSAKSVPAGATQEEAWLVRVLVNIRRDQWRKTSVRDRHDRSGLAVTHQPSGDTDLEAALIAKVLVWQTLEILPPRRRAVIVMYELEGLSIGAIASLLGISAITVRWHLSIGRRDLIRALKPLEVTQNEKY